MSHLTFSRLLIGLVTCALCSVTPALESEPILALGADSLTVPVGTSGRISWSSSHANQCEATKDWSGALNTEGVRATPILQEAGNFRFGLRCWNSSSSVSKEVSIEAVPTDPSLYDSSWISEPTVVPFQPVFAQPALRWRIAFRLDAIGDHQSLVSYDETGQATAGHTTVSVTKTGLIEVRHQAKLQGSFKTLSKSRVQPGRDHELVVEINEGQGLSIYLDGSLEAYSQHAFGTADTKRDLVLGASCAYCNVGETTPLRDSIQGVMNLVIESLLTTTRPTDPDPDPDPEPTPESSGSSQQTLLYSIGDIRSPTVIPFQNAFSRDSALWKIDARLNSLGRTQALVSYDEYGQATAGHTTVYVTSRGFVKARHQNSPTGSVELKSRSKISANRDHEIALKFEKGKSLQLYIDGQLEAQSDQAFGTSATQRPLVVGANCLSCEPGTTSPLKHVTNGTVSFSIHSLNDEEQPAPEEPPTEEKPPVTPAPEPTESDALFVSSVVTKATVVPYQSAFSQQNARWRVNFTASSLGQTQGLFSYDETHQDTAGHTSLDILPDGRLQLRHQDGGSESVRLYSKVAIQTGKTHQAIVTIISGKSLSLELDGVLQAQSSQAFGTHETVRDLVLGATCAYCQKQQTTPLRSALNGSVQLSIESIDGTQPPVEPPEPAPSPVPPPPVDPTPEPIPEPSLNLRTSVDQVQAGEQAKLTWVSENSLSCAATGAWQGSRPVSGSEWVTPQSALNTYTLTCDGAGGRVVSVVAVRVATQLEVTWNAPTHNTDGSSISDLRGFAIHYGTQSGSYSQRLEINDPTASTATISITPGTYYIAVSAENAHGVSSELSTEKQVTVQ